MSDANTRPTGPMTAPGSLAKQEEDRRRRRLDEMLGLVPKMNRRQRRAFVSARQHGAEVEEAFRVARGRR